VRWEEPVEGRKEKEESGGSEYDQSTLCMYENSIKKLTKTC
jgi:hypothetical protein